MCTDSRSRAHSHTKQGRGGKLERSRRHKATRSNAKTRDTKSKRARWTPPARPLPGQLAQRQQSAPPLSPRVSNAINHIGTKAQEAPPWWHADLCEGQEHTRLDENQKTKTSGKILAGDTHKTPGKTLVGDACKAPARSLPGPRQGSCRGHLRGRSQAHAKAPPPFPHSSQHAN